MPERILVEKQSFDLVVSDIVMPGAMDGAALAQRNPRAATGAADSSLVTGYSPSAGQMEFPICGNPSTSRSSVGRFHGS
jgi:DNA-binding LytR/AlgR family response regulator